MRQFKYGLMACVALLVVGCASTGEHVNVPVVDVSGAQPQNRGIESQKSPSIRNTLPAIPPENTAVLSLMKQAARQQQLDDYAGAARALERAIRISPRYAEFVLSFVRGTFCPAKFWAERTTVSQGCFIGIG